MFLMQGHRGPSCEHSVPDAEPLTSRQGDEPARISFDVNAAAACVGNTRAYSAAASAGADLHVIIAPPAEVLKADEAISGKINPASLVTAAAARVTPYVPPAMATEVAPTNGRCAAPLAPLTPLTPGGVPHARGPAAAVVDHPDVVQLETLSLAEEGEAGACCWPSRRTPDRPSSSVPLRRSLSLPILSTAAAAAPAAMAQADAISASSNSCSSRSAVSSGRGQQQIAGAAASPVIIMHAKFGWRMPAARQSSGTSSRLTDLQRMCEVFRLGKEARALCAASRSRRSSCGVSESGL